VAVLFYVKPPAVATSMDLTFFPRFHAILNSLTAVCLVAGVAFIKRKEIRKHRASMLTAFALSCVFLLSYVTYHSLSESTPYPGTGFIRTVYLTILISHIILAALILPLILFTFARALNNKIAQHRKLARWTFPLWLYVAITGVVVYLFMAPYYG
jgi:putative membrane protein